MAWFNESTTPDYTVRDLIDEMKTWFSEGFLYDDIWEALRKKVDNDLLLSEVDIKSINPKRRNKHMSSKLGHLITCAVLAVVVAVTVSFYKFH